MHASQKGSGCPSKAQPPSVIAYPPTLVGRRRSSSCDPHVASPAVPGQHHREKPLWHLAVRQLVRVPHIPRIIRFKPTGNFRRVGPEEPVSCRRAATLLPGRSRERMIWRRNTLTSRRSTRISTPLLVRAGARFQQSPVPDREASPQEDGSAGHDHYGGRRRGMSGTAVTVPRRERMSDLAQGWSGG